MTKSLRVCIVGAGSIGCYVGGRLQAAGVQVDFVGRARLGQELRANGLRLTDYHGADLRVAGLDIRFYEDASVAAECDLVLVTVKSAATKEVARELSTVLRPSTPLISFQNGIDNAAELRTALPQGLVLAGMVPFNVVHRQDGAFHQGTEGVLKVQQHAALTVFLDAFERAGLPLQQHADMRAVLWGKLLLNLNNAINALSNQPLLLELAQRDYRRCLAMAQREALHLLDSAQILPAKLTPLPMRWLPTLLALPDALFRLLFSRMLTIDPLARSSMLDDLDAGRRTEVDWLCGEVVRLAQSLRGAAPINARLAELVHAAETGGRRDWPAAELLSELRRAGA